MLNYAIGNQRKIRRNKRMILLSKEQKIFVMKIADVDYEDEDNASIESICVGNDYEPVIKFKDGSKAVFDWKEICGAAIIFKEQEENKEE